MGSPSGRWGLGVMAAVLLAAGVWLRTVPPTGPLGNAPANDPIAVPLSPDSAPVIELAAHSETAKSSRAPIYDLELDGSAAIAAAVRRARLENKRVLIEWGGNWCGWCYKLYDVFHSDPAVKPIIHEEYELVLLDEKKNRELMEHYGGKETQFAFPHLTVLDAAGKVLTNQETGSLEEGPAHVPDRVAAFLRKWQAERPDAQKSLQQALSRSQAEGKRVLVHSSAPYCGWCKVLTRFLADHEELVSKGFIDLRIDLSRMTGAEELSDSLLKQFSADHSIGTPWLAVLDGEGKVVSHSVLPETGNIGHPYQPFEIEGFLTMLRNGSSQLTEEDYSRLRADLNAYREEREKKLKAQALDSPPATESK